MRQIETEGRKLDGRQGHLSTAGMGTTKFTSRYAPNGFKIFLFNKWVLFERGAGIFQTTIDLLGFRWEGFYVFHGFLGN